MTVRDLSPHERKFYGDKAALVFPESYADLAELVRKAEARFTPLLPAGRGAHAYLGNPPPEGALVVSLEKLNKVLRYEPGDFTIGAQAGLSLAELRQTLAANRQEVPVDFPTSPEGTVGGLIARAPSAVRRARHGPLRGFVIGLHGVRGGPSRYKTGGMVVKNVAGYEVMKLLAGSLGTLGPITEVNFKLRPLPERRAGRIALFPDEDAAWRLALALREARVEPACTWVLQGEACPEIQEASSTPGTAEIAVFWLFEGHTSRVAWQVSQAEGILAKSEAVAERSIAGQELDRVMDYLCEVGSPGPLPREDLGIVRLSALPTDSKSIARQAERAVAELGFRAAMAVDVECGLTTLRWRTGEGAQAPVDQPIHRLRRILHEARASGSIAYLPPGLRRSHDHSLVPDPNRAHALKLLRAFDPNGVFCPGRLLGAGEP